MSNASDNESPSQKSQPGTHEKVFDWKVPALIGVLLLSVVVLVETGILKWDWIGISAHQEISRVEEHTPPIEKGKVSKYTVTTKEIPAKSLWDWLGLLGVPLVLAGLGYWFQDKEKDREDKRQEQLKENAKQNRDKDLQIADDKQKDETLKNYFDSMKELLLEKGLKSSQEGDEVRNIARILTLTVFRQLDSERNQSVTQFLQDLKLITFEGNQPLSVIRFYKAMLKGSDLSGANLGNVSLDNADLRGANLSYAYLSYAELNNAKLGDANLSNAFLSGAYFSDAELNNANLRGANLSYAHFIRTNLSGADLSYTNLSDAELNNANLSGAILCGANLSYAYLYEADLRGANLSGAYLTGATLGKVDFSGADLSGAYLADADLTGADLTDANLSGAILMGVDLRQAKKLIPQQLEGEKPPLLCKVDLPEGFPDKDKLKYRDCNRLPQVLNEHYSDSGPYSDPHHFGTLEKAKFFVESSYAKKPLENQDLEEVPEN